MKLSEIVARLNGISTPIGGVSWTPPQSDVQVARGVLLYLEDRRVLYAPAEVEMPDHCTASVLEMRRFLTDQLTAGGIAADLAADLRAMRAACRKFLDSPHMHHRYGGWAMSDWRFNQALGEMRGVFGVHVAHMAARYGLDVPDVLAIILPAADA